jgi:SAM-dependent methyltransferase
MGCGNVPLYGVYRDIVTDNVCIDWEKSLHYNPHLDLTIDLREELPFEDQSFDTILLTDVLEHIAEPEKVMSESARLLRPSGKLIVGVPFLYWVHEQPHDYYRYTEFALRFLCDRHGLQVAELEPYGGLPEVLFDLTAKGVEILPNAIRGLLRSIHSAAVLSRHLPLMQKLSSATKHAFPLGYLLVAHKVSVNRCERGKI